MKYYSIMSEGWIKLHRKLTDNPLWKCEKFTRGQAWVDLILLANYEYGYFYLRNHKIEVQRGQVGYSQLKLAERWKWSRSKVKKFLNDMEKEQQVVQQQSKSISLITIVNYEIHQQKEQQVVQQQSNSRATAEQQQDTNKKNKNDKNVKNIIKQVFTFYSNQIKKIEDNESLKNNYINLVGYLFGDNAIGCPVEHILKLKNQLNFDEYKKIFKAAYSKNLSVSELFDSWVNNPKYSKGKVSIYLTLNNWINRSEGKTLKPSPEKKWDNTPKTGETLSLLEVINKMKKASMKILIACEFSGIVREVFKAKGHDVWSCDLLDTEIPGQHIKGDVLEVLNNGWNLMIAHPPCTYLSRAAGIVLYNPERLKKTKKAFEFILKLYNSPIEKIAIENPPGWLSTNWKKWDQKIHPWYFGDREMKETCLWLKNLPKLIHIDNNDLFEKKTHTEKPKPASSRMGSDGKIKNKYFVSCVNTAKERSQTFQGIANAMANQWG